MDTYSATVTSAEINDVHGVKWARLSFKTDDGLEFSTRATLVRKGWIPVCLLTCNVDAWEHMCGARVSVRTDERGYAVTWKKETQRPHTGWFDPDAENLYSCLSVS